jgi:hypothetical protein
MADRPRLVLVTRKTPLEQLLERHGTLGQARFYLASRGQDVAWAEQAHARLAAALATVLAAIPPDQRRARVDRAHQSARYRLAADGRQERQSSSGLICATGTGATGWALSIARERGLEAALPAPEEPRLAWLVREPWPSAATGVDLDHGWLGPAERLSVASEMPEDGVVFADGIESDRLEFLAGQTVRVGLAERALNLVVPAA